MGEMVSQAGRRVWPRACRCVSSAPGCVWGAQGPARAGVGVREPGDAAWGWPGRSLATRLWRNVRLPAIVQGPQILPGPQSSASLFPERCVHVCAVGDRGRGGCSGWQGCPSLGVQLGPGQAQGLQRARDMQTLVCLMPWRWPMDGRPERFSLHAERVSVQVQVSAWGCGATHGSQGAPVWSPHSHQLPAPL